MFIVISAFCITQYDNSSKKVMDITIENIEALAQSEGGTRPNLKCWKTISENGSNALTHVAYCGDCTAKVARGWWEESTCYK